MKELLRLGALDGLRSAVTEAGGDFDALATEAGLVGVLTSDSDRYFSHRKLIDLVNLAARKTRRNDLGLVWGTYSSPMLLGPLGVAMMNAPTLRNAIRLLVQYLPQQNEVLRAALVPLDRPGLELFSLINHMKRPPRLVQVTERNLGMLLGLFRGLLGPRFSPVEIWLSHRQDADDDAYRRAYGMAPRFEERVSGFALKRTDLNSAVKGHRGEVFAMAVSYLEQASSAPRTSEGPLATAAAVLEADGSHSLEDVARTMGVHPRGLQRRLRAAGVTYSELRDDVRRKEAERLLLDGRRPLIEIAMKLGFRDQAAFTRASRRWFGAPPSIARKTLADRLDSARQSSRTDSIAVAQRLRKRPEGV